MNPDADAAARPLLILAALALLLSVAVRGALAVSTNPVEGDAGYELAQGLAGLMQAAAVGLFSAWAAVRTLLRQRH